jgi:hypothetical protein
MEQIVSDFFHNTCQIPRKPNIYKFDAVLYAIETSQPPNDGDYQWIATPSGSSSEFYIEAMSASFIGDIDVMHHRNDTIVLPQGHPVPEHLPPGFHKVVYVYELIETSFPCYVMADLVGTLYKRNDEYSYTFTSAVKCRYASTRHVSLQSITHGPACEGKDVISRRFRFDTQDSDVSHVSLDSVACIRCLVWPTQAADWPNRRRKYGWPDRQTIERVVTNACDIVQVAHPSLRDDDFAKNHHWRLSFSRAETVLLNSWSMVQQIAYHMLRIVIREVKAKLPDLAVNNYHAKTLMLWAGELWSPDTWSGCLVSICKRLLTNMVRWMTASKYQMYFVKQCNLYDKIRDASLDSFVSFVSEQTDESLSKWFVVNHIRQCVQEQCPHLVQSLFADDWSVTSLCNALSAVVDWRRSMSKEISWIRFEEACCFMQQRMFFKVLPNVEMCKLVIEHLQAIDTKLLDLFYALCFLKVASALERGHTFDLLADRMTALISFRPDVPNGMWIAVRFQVDVTPADVSADAVRDSCRILIKSAVELLTEFKKKTSSEFSSLLTVVTYDFTAMYAYKYGFYEKCFFICDNGVRDLILSGNNKIWHLISLPDSDLLLLMDDQLVSLICLARLCGCFGNVPPAAALTQLTLLVYLLIQSKLRLKHPPDDFIESLRLLSNLHDAYHEELIIERFILSYLYRKVFAYVNTHAVNGCMAKK